MIKVGVRENDLEMRAARGDRHALARLLEEHTPAIRNRFKSSIPRRWRSALSVDDIVQQTHIDAFVDIDRFIPGGEGSFLAWLTSIAQCNLYDALKMLDADKRGRNHRRVQPEACQDSFVALYEMIGSSRGTPSRRVAKGEAKQAVLRAVQQLPEAYRQVVQMYDLDGCSMEQITRVMGRSPGAVYMVRARALRRLLGLLGNESHYLSVE